MVTPSYLWQTSCFRLNRRDRLVQSTYDPNDQGSPTGQHDKSICTPLCTAIYKMKMKNDRQTSYKHTLYVCITRHSCKCQNNFQNTDLELTPVAFQVRKSGKSKKRPTLRQNESLGKLFFSQSIFGVSISNDILPPTYFKTGWPVELMKSASFRARWSIHSITFCSRSPVDSVT